MPGWIASTGDPDWFSWLAKPPHMTWEERTIRPTDPCPVIVLSLQGNSDIHRMHWGLVPQGCKDPRRHRHTCEAHSGLLLRHPSFRKPFQSSRVLVPVAAFQMRHHAPWMKSRAGRGMMLAAITDAWKGPTSILHTFALVTCDTGKESMPVVLGQNAARMWLNQETPQEELLGLLVPCPSHWLELKGCHDRP